MENSNSCGCIGYGYVPVQQLKSVYNPAEALASGSVFPELVLSIEEYGKVCKSGGMTNE